MLFKFPDVLVDIRMVIPAGEVEEGLIEVLLPQLRLLNPFTYLGLGHDKRFVELL